jgi:hypothetical protein
MGIQLKDGFLFTLRLFTVAILTTATLSCIGAGYYRLEVDNRGRFEWSLGYNCTSIAGLNQEAHRICNTSQSRAFSLWRVNDEFAVFDDPGFCVDPRDYLYYGDRLYGASNSSSSSTTVGAGGSSVDYHRHNVGQCNKGVLRVARIFSVITMILAFVSVIWIIADQQRNPFMEAKVHFGLIISIVITSTCVIIVYCTSINPLRLDPQFCHTQTPFTTCVESMGPGFYLQVSTATLAITSFIICLMAYRNGHWGGPRQDSNDSSSSHDQEIIEIDPNNNDENENDVINCDEREQPEQQVQQPQSEEDHQQQLSDHDDDDDEKLRQQSQQQVQSSIQRSRRCSTRFHFCIRVGRIAEFLLILLGGLASFTDIHATVPPGSATLLPNTHEIPISSKIRIWDGVFCTQNLLWFSFIVTDESVGANAVDNSNIDGDTSTFGLCDSSEIFHMQFATIKVLLGSSLALIFKRDARRNPFFYLVGVVMDVLSLVFISLAVGLFYGGIFPGRDDIDPSYCELWRQQVGTNDCSIKIGDGFWFYCTILILTTFNFTSEFLLPANEENRAYGVRSAVKTVLRRIRQRRFKDILHKPQSDFLHAPSKESVVDGRIVADPESPTDDVACCIDTPTTIDSSPSC